jgi:hypothetical protein
MEIANLGPKCPIIREVSSQAKVPKREVPLYWKPPYSLLNKPYAKSPLGHLSIKDIISQFQVCP